MASPADPGARAVRFINKLSHTGDYYGVPFALRPWQEEPIRRLFGTIRPDGIRQYRKTFWALPRKQGKTELVAASALYLLLGQGRTNRRVYTASGDIKQAGLIFDAARDMISQVPFLANRTVLYEGNDKKILYPEGNSKLEVLSSIPKSKHGLGPTDVLVDEVHVVDEKLIGALTTGFGGRRDPLTWFITTAGWDQTSFCFDEWQYALRVKNGEIEDPTYLPVIYAAEKDEDWTDEAVWRRAMPALGDFCSLEFIRDECRKAKERPRFENEFSQLYLNQWTEQSARWLPTDRWKGCGRITASEYQERDCYAGLDLGVTGDMSAFARVFPSDQGGADILVKFWVPEDGRWRHESRNKSVYKQWEKAGFLTFTPGESADFDQIEQEIVELSEVTPIRLLLADRAYATMMLSRLANTHGIEVKGITQGPITLNEPMTKFEALLLDGTLRHEHNPVLAWNVANATVKTSSTGLMHLDKSASTLRIDGLAATIDAFAGLISDPDAGSSVYESRGFLTV